MLPTFISRPILNPADAMERVHLLEELYIRDGRDIPEHPWNGRYTGLYLKYYRAPDSSPD